MENKTNPFAEEHLPTDQELLSELYKELESLDRRRAHILELIEQLETTNQLRIDE